MTSITPLPNERLKQLEKLVNCFRGAPEDLVRTSVEQLLNRPEEELQRALEYILAKNGRLYGQLT
jgi:hypothetical protein